MAGHKLMIEYCTSCGYLERAVNIIRIIQTRYAVGTMESYTFLPGRAGAFEITVDGQLIFSKLSANRFPTQTELLQKVRPILGPFK